MTPHMSRACMAAAGLVPITFEAPDAHIGCAGRMRITKPQLFGICIRCARLGNDGPQVEPAARIVDGEGRCLNYVDGDVAHVAQHGAAASAAECLTVGGHPEGHESGFYNASVTVNGVGE